MAKMNLGTGLRNTAAFRCVAAAALYTNLLSTYDGDGIPGMYVHDIANKDDNCTSYDSHKYLRDRERLAEFAGTYSYGFWSFNDDSQLIAMGDGKYVVVQPEVDNERFEAPRAMIDVSTIRVAKSRDEFPNARVYPEEAE